MRRMVGAGLAAIALASAPAAHGADAVVAVQDTGINPYHEVFRDDSPRAQQHPSTYIPGYPATALPLKLSLHEANYRAAVLKDCNSVWKKVKRNQLYYVPGTRIVGAISFQSSGALGCPTATADPTGLPYILDTNGHGTMTASRAVSNVYGACRACLVVSVQMPATAGDSAPDIYQALDWQNANTSWVDAESHSWGPIAFGAWDPTGQGDIYAAGPDLARKSERNARAHLAFWASGNGLAGRGGVIGLPGTTTAPQLGPSVVSVGGHDSGYVSAWAGFPPTVVSDDCNDWGAYNNSLDKSADTVGSGTSSATPFASGGAVRILRDARTILGDASSGVEAAVVASGPAGLVPSGPLADGKLTLAEWREVLLKSSSPRPLAQPEDGPTCPATAAPYNAAPVKWSDVPDAFPEYVHIGYGAVDEVGHSRALAVLRGDAPMPDRTNTDRFMGLDAQSRAAQHTVYTLNSDG
jgi:hypothetical protein